MENGRASHFAMALKPVTITSPHSVAVTEQSGLGTSQVLGLHMSMGLKGLHYS